MIKKLRVTVDGKSYDVTVETSDETASAPTPTPSPTPPPSAPPPPILAPSPSLSPSAGDVPSPLAGRIAAIVAQVGQVVKENDHLLTVEAMKMNTFVFAPRAGKVAAILCAAGDAVSEGQVLAKIE